MLVSHVVTGGLTGARSLVPGLPGLRSPLAIALIVSLGSHSENSHATSAIIL